MLLLTSNSSCWEREKYIELSFCRWYLLLLLFSHVTFRYTFHLRRFSSSNKTKRVDPWRPDRYTGSVVSLQYLSARKGRNPPNTKTQHFVDVMGMATCFFVFFSHHTPNGRLTHSSFCEFLTPLLSVAHLGTS